MSMIKVYSRSPIAHKFTIYPNGIETTYVIKGTNSHQILTGGIDVPYVTEMDDAIFNEIKKEYSSHIKLFGGTYPPPERPKKVDALIYIAKNEAEATRIMKDSKPVLDNNAIISKTQAVEKFNNKDV
jgi:hypothetical protein